ncbi:hypothetical protein N0V90_002203 [Kalmusia sp. IMI 367209]|nr:hypothetical protein N0V90_002203 [Kalmusia sp. IMI 367209]
MSIIDLAAMPDSIARSNFALITAGRPRIETKDLWAEFLESSKLPSKSTGQVIATKRGVLGPALMFGIYGWPALVRPPDIE